MRVEKESEMKEEVFCLEDVFEVNLVDEQCSINLFRAMSEGVGKKAKGRKEEEKHKKARHL